MTEQTEIDIGKIIRNGRIKKGLSQKQLANKLRVRPNQISKWEHNYQLPRSTDLIKLANELDIVYDIFPTYKPEEYSSHSSQSKIEEEIENLWRAIRKRDQEEEDFKKIIFILLKEKLNYPEKLNKREEVLVK